MTVLAEDRFVLTDAEFKQEVLDLSRELHAAECATRKKFWIGGVPTSHDLHAVAVHVAKQLMTTPELVKATVAVHGGRQ